MRITNITPQGYLDYSNLTYISEELGNSLFRTQVTPGDIVISQRGTLGQCAVVDDKFEKLNISANIIAVKNFRGISAKFVRSYILSSIGRKQLERFSSGQVQGKITTQDIADILIPAVCGNEQKLVQIIEDGYRSYLEKLRQANDKLQGADAFIMEKLGISMPAAQPHSANAVNLGVLKKGGTFSPDFYHPERMSVLHMMQNTKGFRTAPLSELVEFFRNTVSPAESKYRYLGLAGVESNSGELSGVNEEAAGQAFLYQKGDVLYSRLRPYLNKVLLAEEAGICSAEFHVLRVKTPDLLPGYLAAVMRSPLVVSQAKHMMTGNTHPRISNDDVKKLCIPVADWEVQEAIVRELARRRAEARQLKQQAEKEWTAAKERFEKELLEG